MLLFIGFLAYSPAIKAASAISLAGIDFHQLCRETAHVPLVQAAIHPAYINVWSVQESREHRRYEQYSFSTQRIDVRVEHDISLYHGLIHRTLDLIGESQWKYRNLPPQEDYEHWLIYHTLETHWPGMQRRQGNEPTRTILSIASEYWTQYSERYDEIEAKAAALAKKSWCATNKSILEANAAPVQPVQPVQAVNPLLIQVAQAARELPGKVRTLQPAPAPPQTPAPASPSQLPQPQPPAAQAHVEPSPTTSAAAPVQQAPATSLAVEQIGIASEFSASPRPAENTPKPPAQSQQAKLPPPASTDRPPPVQAAEVPKAPARQAPVSAESLLVEPMWVLSEFALPPVTDQSAPKPPWPAPSTISADLSAGSWR